MATDIRVTKKRCSFIMLESALLWYASFDTRINLAYIEIGTIQHTDHKLAKSQAIRPGMPKYMQSVVLSPPTKVDVAPLTFVAAVQHKGFCVDLPLSHAIKRGLHCICTPRILTRGPPALTWGGALHLHLICTGANELSSIHSIYLIGIDDVEQSTLVAILSTDSWYWMHTGNVFGVIQSFL